MMALNFLVTDRCNITCDFCGPCCGPWYRSHLNAEVMKLIFDRLHSVGLVPVVVFTGGEPLLYRKDVEETIRHIREVSDTPMRIVTNAFWARNIKTARTLLRNLKEAGLTEFNYSVDDFHQRFIPLSTIKNGIEAAIELGIPVHLAHKTYPNSKSNRSLYEETFERQIPILDQLGPKRRGKELLTISTGYTLPIGRGSELVNLERWVPNDLPETQWKGPCKEVLASITISANGYLSPCCGLVDRNLDAFYVASVVEYDVLDILEYANKTVLYNWLALEGPSAIMEYIMSQDPSLQFLGRYIQNCQICQELFSDSRKVVIILDSLERMGKVLSVNRCIYESHRISLQKKLRKLARSGNT